MEEHATRRSLDRIEPPPRIVLAEDDDEVRWGLSKLFQQRGWTVHAVPHGADLLDYLAAALLLERRRPVPDVIVSDMRMPGFNGLGILEGLRGAGWLTPFILITAFGDEETRRRATRMGATAWFDKPLDLGRFEKAVERAVHLERSKPAHERHAYQALAASMSLAAAARLLSAEEETEVLVVRPEGAGWVAVGVLEPATLGDDPACLADRTVGQAMRPWARGDGELSALLGRLERAEIHRMYAIVRAAGPSKLACIRTLERAS